MKRYMPFSGYLRVIMILLLTGLVWSCIKDNRDNCYKSCQLIVRPIEADSVREGDISEVILFVFDKEQKFMKSIETRIDQATELPCSSDDELYVVAWGNLNGGNQLLPALQSAQFLEGVQVKLVMKDGRYAYSPDDLFQGAKLVSRKAGDAQPDILWIKRKVARVTVVARGLQQYLNTADEDFSYTIRGTNNALGLDGTFAGDEVYLQPDAAFDQNREFRTSAFHVLPSDHLAVDVYKADRQVYTVNQDAAGNPLVAPEGKKLTVIIDFSGDVHVTISISDWEETDVTEVQ